MSSATLCKLCLMISSICKFAYDNEIDNSQIKAHIAEKQMMMGEESKAFTNDIMKKFPIIMENVAIGANETEVCNREHFCGPVYVREEDQCEKCREAFARMRDGSRKGRLYDELMNALESWPMFEQIYDTFGYDYLKRLLKKFEDAHDSCRELQVCM